MYGCEFCKMDKRWNEYCTLTGEPTKGAVMCDFEYERCGYRSDELKRREVNNDALRRQAERQEETYVQATSPVNED